MSAASRSSPSVRRDDEQVEEVGLLEREDALLVGRGRAADVARGQQVERLVGVPGAGHDAARGGRRLLVPHRRARVRIGLRVRRGGCRRPRSAGSGSSRDRAPGRRTAGWSGRPRRCGAARSTSVAPSNTVRLNSVVADSPLAAIRIARLVIDADAQLVAPLARGRGVHLERALLELGGVAGRRGRSRKRRTMIAVPPPLRKKSRTAKPSLLGRQRPPNTRSKSPKLVTVIGSSTGPRGAAPTKAVIDVATPTMVRTPLGTSSM